MGQEIASIEQHIPSTAALTDDEFYLAWPHKGTWVLDYVGFTPATAVAIDGTDYLTVTISVNASSASTSWTTACSHTTFTGGSAFVLGTAIAPTVTKVILGQGYQIRVASVNTGGSGQIMDGTYTFRATKVN